MARRFVKATINDVAERAGVSITTVSLYLRGRKSACSLATAERIRESIDALQYVPHPSAGRARDKATRTIGLVLESHDDIADTFDGRQSYHERLNRELGREADANSYGLLRYPREIRRAGIAKFFLDGRVDGVLLDLDFDYSSLEQAAAIMPIVLVNRQLNIPKGCGAVCTNEDDTMRLALDHLWQLGHRRIAHLASPLILPVEGVDAGEIAVAASPSSGGHPAEESPNDCGTRRCRAYAHYMRERGVFDPALIGTVGSWCDALRGDTVSILRRWFQLPQKPTAVVCAGDGLAIALAQSLSVLGLLCPRDLSITGVDNRTAASEQIPPLTTVDVPVETIGREAMRLLMRLMTGEDVPADQLKIALPVNKLVVRASTAVHG
ncbi:MAG: LacI family DNA-binding transcriptional regulator [Capsulimonadaceae bacterium]|nr:LacI family DNA-binding transcriptional regulator [Capsulimonadaceae bacterium]